jgi:hypothetical protein
VRKNVPLPLERCRDRGVMATVYADGGYGYAATSDLTPDGIRARSSAPALGAATASRALFDTRPLPRPRAARASTRRRRSTRPSPRRASGTSSDGRVDRGRDRRAHRRLDRLGRGAARDATGS